MTIPLRNPYSNTVTLPPGGSFSMFDSTIATGLDGTSVLSMELLSAQNSIYRIQLVSGDGAFRTARSSVSTPAGCTVTLNNNAVAVFNFASATLTGVQPGDIMRIAGQILYDTGPFQFNPLNAGLWTVLSVSGTSVTVARPVGVPFSGVQESPAGPVNNDVEFYANNLVQVGNKIDVTGTFSVVSQRTYTVLDATPTTIDFCSTAPIPLESNLSYVPGTLTAYTDLKRLVYIECDQSGVVQFNADTSNNNRLTPVRSGDELLPALACKWGDTYACTVVNQSVNPMNVKFFFGE
jgi:hypothetical protein